VGQRGTPLEFFVNQFKNNCEERTAQVSKRGRPLFFFVNQFKNNIMIYENKATYS
jgi:hypothetical protein